MQLSLDNYIINTNVEQHRTSDDKIGDTFLVEAGGIAIRVDLIVVEDDQMTTSVSTPITSSFTTTNIIHHRILRIYFYLLF